MLNFLFSAVSFNDAIRRVQYLKSYRGYREEQVANIKKTQSLLEQKINTLAENKKEKSKVLMEQTKEMKTLEEEKKMDEDLSTVAEAEVNRAWIVEARMSEEDRETANENRRAARRKAG